MDVDEPWGRHSSVKTTRFIFLTDLLLSKTVGTECQAVTAWATNFFWWRTQTDQQFGVPATGGSSRAASYDKSGGRRILQLHFSRRNTRIISSLKIWFTVRDRRSRLHQFSVWYVKGRESGRCGAQKWQRRQRIVATVCHGDSWSAVRRKRRRWRRQAELCSV